MQIIQDKKREPFAFQVKTALRQIESSFEGSARTKAMAYYLAITWIVSDFSKGDKPVLNWTGLIAKKSGLNRGIIYKMHKLFKGLGLIDTSSVGTGKGGYNKIVIELIR